MNPKLHSTMAALTLMVSAFASVPSVLAQDTVPDLFRQLDKNSDGKVSREEAGKPFIERTV